MTHPPRGSSAAWREGLPLLHAGGVTLREVAADDAVSLFAAFQPPQVGAYIAAPPPSVAAVGKYVHWAQTQRRAGRHVCFGIVPDGGAHAVGIIQVWPLRTDFDLAEWGFVIGDHFWGGGVFDLAARLVLDFAFTELGVYRLEARAACANGRGNGALRKLGATREATLRRNFECRGQYLDHAMWSILADDGKPARRRAAKRVNHNNRPASSPVL